jgi:hypothetical protein
VLEHKIHCNNRFIRSQWWDGQVGLNGKDGKIDRGLRPSRRPSSSRSRCPWIRLSRRFRRTRMSAGVVPGPVPVVPGSTPLLRPAKRRTGPGGATQRIGRGPCDTTGGELGLDQQFNRYVAHHFDAKPPSAVRQPTRWPTEATSVRKIPESIPEFSTTCHGTGRHPTTPFREKT